MQMHAAVGFVSATRRSTLRGEGERVFVGVFVSSSVVKCHVVKLRYQRTERTKNRTGQPIGVVSISHQSVCCCRAVDCVGGNKTVENRTGQIILGMLTKCIHVHMYIYVFVYMYVYIYICTYVCVNIELGKLFEGC